jgi:Arf-GAP/coiled-coil/ANK repeat/PH domain-containing protein
MLIDQANRSITRNLTKFLKEDMKQMKETKGYFNKISNDLDSALSKNAAASKSRPADIEDASNLLTATRSCFRYTGMDYVFQIAMLQASVADPGSKIRYFFTPWIRDEFFRDPGSKGYVFW